MVTLYDQFGRPVSGTAKPGKRDAYRPLAAAPITDRIREYVTDGLTPQRLAALLKEADGGEVRRQADLFELIEERDGHLIGETGKRKNVILDVEFRIEANGEDARAERIADECRGMFAGFDDWEDVLVSMQDAVGKGYAAHEILWEHSEGQVQPAGFEFIEQRRFVFQDGMGQISHIPRLITDETPMGMEIPAFRLLWHRYGGKSGHPVRSGIHRVCAWMWLIKNYSIKDWVVFCEVFGMPLRLGKYSTSASEEDKLALETAVRMLGSDAAGVISESTMIEFVESAAKSGSGDLYRTLANFANAEMSKALLGQTLSAEVGDRGSYAAAKTHNEVRIDLMRADARAIATTVRNGLIRPWVIWNYGADAPIPTMRPVWEEPEDYKAKADWLEKVTAKVAVPKQWFLGQFGVPEPEEGEETVGGPQAVSGRETSPDRLRAAKSVFHGDMPAILGIASQGANEAAQETAPDIADRVAAAAADDAESFHRPLLDGMRRILDEAVASGGSLEDVRDRMLLLARADVREGATALAQRLALAELAGRAEVINEG